MSLTAEEKNLVRGSWKKLISEHGLEKVGLVVFVRLFTDHPAVIPLFENVVPADTQITLENLQNIPKMANHALSVATSIGEIVASLDSSSKFKDEVEMIAEIHKDKPVSPAHFEVLGQVLLNVLETTLEKKADDDVIIAWGKAYKAVYDGTTEKL